MLTFLGCPINPYSRQALFRLEEWPVTTTNNDFPASTDYPRRTPQPEHSPPPSIGCEPGCTHLGWTLRAWTILGIVAIRISFPIYWPHPQLLYYSERILLPYWSLRNTQLSSLQRYHRGIHPTLPLYLSSLSP